MHLNQSSKISNLAPARIILLPIKVSFLFKNHQENRNNYQSKVLIEPYITL